MLLNRMVKMKRMIIWGFVALGLAGCASLPSSLPEGYKGEVATIQDTAITIDAGKADLFYLAAIDGGQIKNSRSETIKASHGRGNYLSTVLLNNSVPVGTHKFTIVGRTEYAMPIRALAGDVYEVKGEVEFSPLPNAKYTIKGSLSEMHSSVWIENTDTKEIVGEIKNEGTSKLGIFQK